MNESRRKPTTGTQSHSLCDKWHGAFYIPSRRDEAGHTKAFDYPVAEHWGEAEMFSSAGGTRTDNTSVRMCYRTRYQLSHPGSPFFEVKKLKQNKSFSLSCLKDVGIKSEKNILYVL